MTQEQQEAKRIITDLFVVFPERTKEGKRIYDKAKTQAMIIVEEIEKIGLPVITKEAAMSDFDNVKLSSTYWHEVKKAILVFDNDKK